MVGKALGRSERADELEAETAQQFAEARAQHPEFEGTEVAVGAYTSEAFGAYVRGDTRVDYMESLGLVNAFSSDSVLGIRYALENAGPLFAEALHP